ncbi:RING finger protein-like protein [Aaosphaeria arxii CBS 175.79]|uniref:RBR-type E3 ubiquitin transferase n=1 Tax=Aaosphaeria arxii CBS 175.79 TaxID=1450172 RepID=A0A6A5XRL6_9PLEO|nr:RING finger protein-like protein [Aaosphaeria arxii CBS 175.79]KAF2015330.1 RING finger protein-like protein [Aaosphaeria arxii CBS 175.79]
MAEEDTADERVEELETLQSIYPELEINLEQPTRPSARINLQVSPIAPLQIIFEPESAIHRLSYLPPLLLDLILIENYPLQSPPEVKLTSSWIPKPTLQKLEKEASSQWEEYGGMQMIFAYISYLQEAAESSFGLSSLKLPISLKSAILDYNDQMKREKFDHETFDCGVCLEPKKGSACYQMQRCGHVFCKACLQDYYNNCIAEGDVNNVKCMAPDCGKTGNAAIDRQKKERLVSPKELLQIPLSFENVKRYAELKRKKKIEADPTIVFCPRSWCQGAMRTEKYPKIVDVSQMEEDSDDEVIAEPANDGAGQEEGQEEQPKKLTDKERDKDRLVVCEDCNLAFCKQCLASWHGDYYRCMPRQPKDLTEEDQASLNFILANTSPCPECTAPCQKSYGCNHMTCFQCKTHFCYLCGAWLEPGNPYKHFNEKRNKGCYQRLMDLATGDNGDGGVQFGGRRGAEQQAEFWEREALRIQMEELE